MNFSTDFLHSSTAILFLPSNDFQRPEFICVTSSAVLKNDENQLLMFFVSVKFAEGGTTSIKMGEGTHFNLPGIKMLLVKNGNYFFETKQIHKKLMPGFIHIFGPIRIGYTGIRADIF